MSAPDLSQLSDAERYGLAKKLVIAMRGSLPKELYAGSFTVNSKLPYKACSFREVLIHRQSDLADVAMDLYEAKRLVPAFVMTRAVVETTALMYSLHTKAQDFLTTKDEDAFDGFLMKGMLGSRDETTSHESVNILKSVDRMDKEFDGLRDMYNTLCEFTHPNWSGTMGAYSRIEREKYLLHLGKEHHSPPLAYGLAPFIGCMAIFTDHYNALAGLLKSIDKLYAKN